MAQRSMLTHADIWNAVDRLAARAGLSASGLAKKAGLDPTTFNKSKRITPEGRPRWPSTESIAKSLQATGVTMDTFVSLITDRGGASTQSVPLIGLAEAGAGGYFDDERLPGRQGLGRDRVPGGQRRARLCAGSVRRLDAAGLSRRHRDRGLARRADPPRRPRRGEDAATAR